MLKRVAKNGTHLINISKVTYRYICIHLILSGQKLSIMSDSKRLIDNLDFVFRHECCRRSERFGLNACRVRIATLFLECLSAIFKCLLITRR